MRSEIKLSGNEGEERVALGCALAFPERALEVFGECDESDFTHFKHQALAKTLSTMAREGVSTDPGTVASRWSKYGFGTLPMDLLADLPDQCPTADIGLESAREVRKLANRRRLQCAVEEAREHLNDPRSQPEEALGMILGCGATAQDVKTYEPADLISNLIERTEERYNAYAQGKRVMGISTGFRQLDNLTDGLQRGELAIFGARPSQGKSAIALNMAADIAIRQGIPVLFISLEMSAYSIARRLAACSGEIPLEQLKTGSMNQSGYQKFLSFGAKLKQSPFHVAYSGNMDMSRVAMLVRQYVMQYDVQVVVVDYLQRVKASGKHEKVTYAVGSVSTALKAIAVSENVAMLCPCQLNRAAAEEAPSLHHLADSGQIERDGDMIALIHFPDRGNAPDRASLIVAKQRDGETGSVEVRWNASYCRFENAGIDS